MLPAEPAALRVRRRSLALTLFAGRKSSGIEMENPFRLIT
jgi:hypothetical protein